MARLDVPDGPGGEAAMINDFDAYASYPECTRRQRLCIEYAERAAAAL
ncbi:hypothetical protein [Mycobacterium sp. 852002-40037_SCH5390672]|nr:hypothetical protein [Mycobacterium sp. 852002-40037_SCH5390672]